jgi:hypothetical protein
VVLFACWKQTHFCAAQVPKFAGGNSKHAEKRQKKSLGLVAGGLALASTIVGHLLGLAFGEHAQLDTRQQHKTNHGVVLAKLAYRSKQHLAKDGIWGIDAIST